ncbi:MAG TPA: MXAN_5187 C-terminal domain-containing protein [Polyangiaceae bacterium]|nr:MXAN_5187 C-terminal domain-containing protein [Polyangiaceae bacterium]
MENAELDVALEELETRLERLRALYEQYFMGIERIEPQIPRKDVDRRIYVLRREKIRNTAKRFKLQTIISRYNTFQQYWQRICREIENGTYKRHVIRAERIAPGGLLTIAARRRLGRRATEEASDSAPPPAPSSAPPAASSTPPRASSQPPSVPRPAPVAAAPSPKLAPPPKPGARPAKPAQPPATPAPAAAKPFESLDLDMDFMGDWDPSSPKGGKLPPAKPFGEALAKPLGGATAPLKPAAERGVPAPQNAAPAPSAPKPPNPNPSIEAAKPAQSSELVKPAAASAGVAPAAKLGAAPIARPKPAAPMQKPPAPVSISDDRVRELHARLVEAKRQTQDAAAVSVEGLAKSLKATEAKLREQHKNRKIDFDVVIKDGKAVLKPIVR